MTTSISRETLTYTISMAATGWMLAVFVMAEKWPPAENGRLRISWSFILAVLVAVVQVIGFVQVTRAASARGKAAAAPK